MKKEIMIASASALVTVAATVIVEQLVAAYRFEPRSQYSVQLDLDRQNRDIRAVIRNSSDELVVLDYAKVTFSPLQQGQRNAVPQISAVYPVVESQINEAVSVDLSNGESFINIPIDNFLQPSEIDAVLFRFSDEGVANLVSSIRIFDNDGIEYTSALN